MFKNINVVHTVSYLMSLRYFWTEVTFCVRKTMNIIETNLSNWLESLQRHTGMSILFNVVPIPVILFKVKSKGIPRQAEVALGVPGRLRPRIFLTFSTTRVVGHQPNALAAFTPGKIPGTHFQRMSWPQGTWFCRKEPRKKSLVTPPGFDPGTVWLVAQRLNHYTIPGPCYFIYRFKRKRHLGICNAGILSKCVKLSLFMTVLKVRICLASCTSQSLQFTKFLTLKHMFADFLL